MTDLELLLDEPAEVPDPPRTCPEHDHRAIRAKWFPFTSAAAHPQNPAAHGGSTIIETCWCGATRAVSCKGKHREISGWLSPEEDRYGHRSAA